MTDRFPDAVLIEAIEAYESFDDYRSVTAMRAVLEAHLETLEAQPSSVDVEDLADMIKRVRWPDAPKETP